MVNTGTVAYFPPRRNVDEVDGDKLKVNFGKIKNAAADPTSVTFDITFNIVSHEGTVASADITAKIGGQDVTLPEFTTTTAVSILELN